jgi:tRNA G18 (ribose-2'-O)-methylase SpoU
VYFEDTLEAVQQLKSNQYAVIAIEQTQNSTMLNKANFIAQKTAVVLGHEMDGVQQSVINSCDYCIEIPQEGTKHSLNVSVCAGILCWEYYRQNLTPQ